MVKRIEEDYGKSQVTEYPGLINKLSVELLTLYLVLIFTGFTEILRYEGTHNLHLSVN